MNDPTLRIRRRNLPHWTMDGSTYFITFRTHEGTLTAEERRLVLDHVRSGHDKFYRLAAVVVMPDHVHLLLSPLAPYDLSRVMKGIKGKPLLYVYRVLLTGIHLMQTGEVQANLGRLNESSKLPYIPELIERKVTGAEKACMEQVDLGFHQREYERLRAELEQAYQESKLPEAPSGADALDKLLVRIRLSTTAGR